jgi:hypothetical protein
VSTLPAPQRLQVDRFQWISLGVGIVTLLACILGAPFSPAQFFRAYLTAYFFYLGIGLGCLTILLIYYLTGGAWGFVTRRLFEAGMRTLPLLAVLFTPIAYGLGYLYLWAQPEVVAGDKGLQHKQIYLNAPFFWGRAAIYFISWLALAYFLSSWSRRQDETDDPALARKFSWFSGPGLIVYGITITFASIDWIMSLQPAFHSTIFGPLVASGQLLSAFAFVILLLAWLVGQPPLSNLISLEVLNDLGNLLLTLLVIWAYMVWFQFMLIWIANLPSDVIWYLPRSRGGWQWVAWALFVLHFAIPFLLLLQRSVKRDPPSLAMTAGLILFMQLVFNYYQVMPAFWSAGQMAEHWMDFLTPLGLGGIWLAYFLWQLKRRPVLPRHDWSREEAVHLREISMEQAAREEVIHHG